MNTVRDVLVYLVAYVATLPLMAWGVYLHVIERIATATSWGEFFERFAALVEWLLWWRMLGLLLVLVSLLIAGFVTASRPLAALVLAFVAVVMLGQSFLVMGISETLASVWIPLMVAVPVANAAWVMSQRGA
jgi:hypothetical protein